MRVNVLGVDGTSARMAGRKVGLLFYVDSSEPGDRTNNATERLIGLDYKIRIKTMHGLKNEEKVLDHCYLSEYIRGSDSICDLREVV
jgi:hypothetical protein